MGTMIGGKTFSTLFRSEHDSPWGARSVQSITIEQLGTSFTACEDGDGGIDMMMIEKGGGGQYRNGGY